MENIDEFLETQAVLDALYVIGGKWKFPIMYSLCSGKKRFNQLTQDLNSISPSALTNALKDLEANGIISRNVYSTVPITVEYELTKYGKELKPLLYSLQEWGKKHRKKIINKEI